MRWLFECLRASALSHTVQQHLRLMALAEVFVVYLRILRQRHLHRPNLSLRSFFEDIVTAAAKLLPV